jgi:hypothetical protein
MSGDWEPQASRGRSWVPVVVALVVLSMFIAALTILASIKTSGPKGVGGQILVAVTATDPDLQDHLPVHKKVYVVETVSSAWIVSDAVKYIDRYSTSEASIVKKCPADAWRCIVIKPGKLKGNPVGWSSWNWKGATITIDEGKAKSRKWSAANRRYLLVHEIGHAYYLRHVTSCTAMNRYRTCGGKATPSTLTSAQRSALANW